MKALTALLLAITLFSQVACANRRDERMLGRAAVGAGAGALVAGPVGAVAGGAVGAATTR